MRPRSLGEVQVGVADTFSGPFGNVEEERPQTRERFGGVGGLQPLGPAGRRLGQDSAVLPAGIQSGVSIMTSTGGPARLEAALGSGTGQLRQAAADAGRAGVR